MMVGGSLGGVVTIGNGDISFVSLAAVWETFLEGPREELREDMFLGMMTHWGSTVWEKLRWNFLTEDLRVSFRGGLRVVVVV